MAFPVTKEQLLPSRLVARLEGRDGHEGAVMGVRFNASGDYCLTAGRDRLIKLWNPHTQLLIKTYKGHSLEVNSAEASRDNSRFVSGSSDKAVMMWDVATGQCIRKIRAHSGPVNDVRLNEDATIIVSASYDSTVKCWDLRSAQHEPVQTLPEATDSVPGLDLSGHEILTGSVDGVIRNYDMRMGKLRADTVGDPVTCVRFSHDNNCILAASLDGYVRLFDKDNGSLLGSYTGHVNSEFKVDCGLSYNDAIVAAGSEDGHLHLWDLVNGKELFKHQFHRNVICALSFHPKTMCLATASIDGTVCIIKSPADVMKTLAKTESDE